MMKKNATSTGQARSIRRSMMNSEPEHPNMVLLKSFKNMSKPYTWSILHTIYGHFFFKLFFVNCKSFCGCIDLPLPAPLKVPRPVVWAAAFHQRKSTRLASCTRTRTHGHPWGPKGTQESICFPENPRVTRM